MNEEEIPQVVYDLLEVLPQFRGADLESQLQNYDIFLQSMSPFARPKIAKLLRLAAAKTPDETSRTRIEEAADEIASGGRAAAPYDHQAAMREYRAQHAANFAPKPDAVEPVAATPAAMPEPYYASDTRIVDERAYQTAIRKHQARRDETHEGRSGGIVERWIDPNGRIVAWIHVRYWHGEEEYDYVVAS